MGSNPVNKNKMLPCGGGERVGALKRKGVYLGAVPHAVRPHGDLVVRPHE